MALVLALVMALVLALVMALMFMMHQLIPPLQQSLVSSLAEYSTDLGNGLAGNDRVVPLLRRTEVLLPLPPLAS